ncbi:MAG: ATPase, T2SS/T4P/T4SS family [Planctomycetota bacterium]
MPQLQLKLADGRGRPIRLTTEPITVGRHPDNRLRIKDDMSSRHHCVIEPAPDVGADSFRLRDLNSRNGTKLNGMKVTESILSPGDVIGIGALEFCVEVRGAEAKGQLSARRANGKGRNGSVDMEEAAANRAWMTELQDILEAFAGRGTNDENPVLIDARGQDTKAIAGSGEGPRCIRDLLRVASRTEATDIHVEPKTDATHIRMRVDGQMVWITEVPKKVAELSAGVLKTACHMQAAARDAIQEGHFSCRFPTRRVEYRVSFTPSVHGQKLVVRVLDQKGVPTSIEDLGLVPYMTDKIKQITNLDAGMFLVCGPTGSGKTTTLYNCLREIDRDARNVVTIEDPVEYQIDGVTQMPIDSDRGNTFGSMLRSVLRQDPDVILVGEIRDDETARVGMQAAMTGHLVFSTVHAKDTVAAVFRLLDLRVEPYLVANSLSLVLAQRLVRALCQTCKSEVPASPGLVSRMGRYGRGVTKTMTPMGCKNCLKTGYRGRHALFELLDVTDELRDVILSNPNIAEMKKIINEGQFTTLAEFGWKLVAEGTTSIEEVDRVAGGK